VDALSVDLLLVDDPVEFALGDPAAVADWYERAADRGVGASRVRCCQAAGVAYRELQQLDRSVTVLREAALEAERFGDQRLVGLIALSRSATDLYAGRGKRAVTRCREALEVLDGDDLLTGLSQLAGILHRTGRGGEAIHVFDEGLALARTLEARSPVAELHNNRAIMLGYLGRHDEAERGFVTARDLFASLATRDQVNAKRVVDMTHNLGWIAGRQGDLVRALILFDEAKRGYDRLHFEQMLPDRCEVLVAAGLYNDALEEAESICILLDAQGAKADLAESLLMLAEIAIRLGKWDSAERAASRAGALLHASDRRGWSARAASLEIDARHAARDLAIPSRRVFARLRVEMSVGGLRSAVDELDILHARLAIRHGALDRASEVLRGLRIKSLGVQSRSAARALRASLHQSHGRWRDARRELLAGVKELDRVRASSGSSELRVALGRHGAELMEIGLDIAFQSGRPTEILRWSERGRARSLKFPPVRAETEGDEVHRSLDLLRDLDQRLRSDGITEPEFDELTRRRSDVSAEVRRASHRRSGGEGLANSDLTMARVRASLTDGVLVQIVEHGGALHAVVVTRRKSALVYLGAAVEIVAMMSRLRSAATRVLTGRGDRRVRDASKSVLDDTARQLDDVFSSVFPDGIQHVILVPTAALHAAAWSAIPALDRRPFVVAPSIGTWLSAIGHRRTDVANPVVVAGPRLPLARAEAEAVAALTPGTVPLCVDDAVVNRVADALESANSIHLVCHGSFVADNPLFSSLELADGPLYAYDIERLRAVPSLIVLSACHAALSADRPGDELMGFVATLLAAGSSCVIASALPVPDHQITVDAMVSLQHALIRGSLPAVALQNMRESHPTVGMAFTAFGA
jgi:tetratricopeptide (TPR) repeat protein